jgi:hypothetical protein
MDLAPSPTHVRTALFVDFDNIYLGLHNEDPRAAEQFATHPGRWLQWLQEDLPSEGLRPRKILFRRCYLNPSQFSRFRPYFIRSAFEVVDCPPLTRGGKTSADIQMVMDLLDTLGHTTVFEEFIIMSGDADFTPVLLRLSKHDRRSVVLAAGPASAAYKAACDLLIDQDTFLEEAIGVTDGPISRPGASIELLQHIADKVRERAGVTGELVATDLPGIFREFPEFTPDSNWLGFYSLRGMASAVVRARRDLEMIDGDPWRVRVRDLDGEDPYPPRSPGAPGMPASFGTPAAMGAGTSGAGALGTGSQGAIGLHPANAAQGAGASNETYPAGADSPPREGLPLRGGAANGLQPFNGTPATSPALLRSIADKVYERASAVGELLATDLPAIYREFPEFTPNSNWLGFYSLRGMTNAVVRARGDLGIYEGDPWRVRVNAEAPAPPAAEAAAGGETGDDEEARPDAALAAEHNRLTDEIVAYVRTLLDEADSPIPIRRAAQLVIDRFGEDVLASRWAGAGTFRDLLAGRELPFRMSSSQQGFLYDPDLHQVPHEGGGDELEVGDPEITSLAHRVHRLTDTPYLTSVEYGLVFRNIAEEVNEEGYFLTRTSKAVRDRCIEAGTPVARASVNFILRGIISAGHRFDPDARNEPLALAQSFVKNVLGLCESAGLPLPEEEREMLSSWILGDLERKQGEKKEQQEE